MDTSRPVISSGIGLHVGENTDTTEGQVAVDKIQGNGNQSFSFREVESQCALPSSPVALEPTCHDEMSKAATESESLSTRELDDGWAVAKNDNPWKKVLETDKDGNVLHGQKRDLVDAVVNGSEIRFSLFSDEFMYITGITSASLVGKEDVCVQSLFHISKSGPFDFDPDAHWLFINYCTTGFMHMSRWYVGKHRCAGSTKEKYGAKWFVRDLQLSPVYSNTSFGSRTHGNLDTLISAVMNGADVKVFETGHGYVQGFTNLVVYDQGSLLSGQYPWHISQVLVGDHWEFQNDAYWWATILSNTGKREMSRWNVGEHKSRNHNSHNISMNWFADASWTLAYSHDSNGNKMDGDLEFLREAIMSGKRVKVITGTYSIEADNVYISNSGHVSAQLLGHLSKASESSFQKDVYWYWQHVSTTGDVETIRYDIGSSRNRGESHDRKAMKWFINTRHWHRVLSTNRNGKPVFGSKSNLINAVQSGFSLRYVIHLPDNSFRVLDADNIAVQDQHVAAQSIRSVSDKIGEEGVPRTFESPPYWHFTITITNGKQKSVWWRVGVHECRPETESSYDIDWFVC